MKRVFKNLVKYTLGLPLLVILSIIFSLMLIFSFVIEFLFGIEGKDRVSTDFSKTLKSLWRPLK